MAKAKKKAPKKKAEKKEKSWIEQTCPASLSPKGWAENIVANPQNFENGNGPEIKKAEDYLKANK